MILHLVNKGTNQDIITWAENSFSTALGALILILTGRIARADVQQPPVQPQVNKHDGT